MPEALIFLADIHQNSPISFASVRSRPVTAILFSVVCLSLWAGCRTDPSIELLEAEARYLEDKVYALQDIVEQKEAELEAIRKENEKLKDRSGIPEKRARSPLSDGQPAGSAANDPQSSNQLPEEIEPQIDFGEPGTVPELASVAPGHLDPVALLPTPSEDLPHIESSSVDLKVNQFKINPKLTGGYDINGEPGDDGLMIVIEPQNESGIYVPYAGAVSIVLLDPAYSGEEGYVGRWDFDTLETARKLKETLVGKGIHLKIPWSKKPEHDNLLLHVRFTTQEGEVLQEKKDIQVDLQGQRSAGWTPAAVPLPTAATATSESKSEASTAKNSDWQPYR